MSPPEIKTIKNYRAAAAQGHFSTIFFYVTTNDASSHPLYLVFGVGRVDSLAVSAGLQQDLDGVELQQNLTGHAVEEGDVGQGCRRQEEYFATGGALAQL